MSLRVVWLAMATALALVWWSGHRYLAAAETTKQAEQALTGVIRQTALLEQLRAAAPPEFQRSRPAAGVASRVAAAVAAAGIGHSALHTVTPELESAVNGGAFRRTAVRVTLDPVTLPELGRMLEAWRKAEPGWVVSSIELLPTASQRRGTHRLLRAGLSMEYVFAAPGEERADGKP